jgi:hypothetical protein
MSPGERKCLVVVVEDEVMVSILLEDMVRDTSTAP